MWVNLLVNAQCTAHKNYCEATHEQKKQYVVVVQLACKCTDRQSTATQNHRRSLSRAIYSPRMRVVSSKTSTEVSRTLRQI